MGEVRHVTGAALEDDPTNGYVVEGASLSALKSMYVIEEQIINPGDPPVSVLTHIRDFPASAPAAPNAPVLTATPNYQVSYTLTQDPDNWHSVTLYEWLSGNPIASQWVAPGGTAGFFDVGAGYDGVEVFARAFRVASQGGPYPSPDSPASNRVFVSQFGG